MIENKQVMANNILHYMSENNVNATDICKACGFKQNTFSDWVNAKTYPRIDKIEIMARYFHISKADLVEERKDKIQIETEPNTQKAVDIYNQIMELPQRDQEELFSYLQYLRTRSDSPHSNS